MLILVEDRSRTVLGVAAPLDRGGSARQLHKRGDEFSAPAGARDPSLAADAGAVPASETLNTNAANANQKLAQAINSRKRGGRLAGTTFRAAKQLGVDVAGHELLSPERNNGTAGFWSLEG